MAIFEQIPWTDFHELNLDWIVDKLRELEERVAALEEEAENDGDI